MIHVNELNRLTSGNVFVLFFCCFFFQPDLQLVSLPPSSLNFKHNAVFYDAGTSRVLLNYHLYKGRAYTDILRTSTVYLLLCCTSFANKSFKCSKFCKNIYIFYMHITNVAFCRQKGNNLMCGKMQKSDYHPLVMSQRALIAVRAHWPPSSPGSGSKLPVPVYFQT